MAKSPEERRKAHEALVKRIEDKVRIRDLPAVISCFSIGSVITISGILLGALTLAYNAYPFFNKPAAPPPIQRTTPRHINLKSLAYAGPAQDEFPWLVPTVAFLENLFHLRPIQRTTIAAAHIIAEATIKAVCHILLCKEVLINLFDGKACQIFHV